MNKTLPTQFAPAERATPEQTRQQMEYLAGVNQLNLLLDAMAEIVLVLNQQRQAVYANLRLLDFLGVTDMSQIIGLRPGEILQCQHAHETKGGCGTSAFCRYCGAARAILTAQQGTQSMQECLITRESNGEVEALDLRVWATPLKIGRQAFTVFTLTDISDEKRRLALEHVFFHDILNTAGIIRGAAELMPDYDAATKDTLSEMIYKTSDRLIQEIQAQRTLLAAENGELMLQPVMVQSLELLLDIVSAYVNHRLAKSRRLHIASDVEDVRFYTDKALLGRVLGNMVKNALEAILPDEIVTIGCQRVEDTFIEFWVHNPTVMPDAVKRQVFQRSFSTKGQGRGLGTYSMRLLTERYLQGQISFTSCQGEGTTFRVRYPLTPTFPDI